MALDVAADLQVEVDGVAATLTGSQGDLTLRCADPVRLLASVSSAALPAGIGRINGPRALGRLAELLESEGVRLTVTGPAGSVLALGKGAPSVAGRLLTGSAYVRPGSVAGLRPLALAQVRREARPLALASGLAVLVALVFRIVRRRATDS